MKRRLILGITGAMLAVVAFSGSAFAATLFDNGSFETGPATGTLTTGATAISGWTVTGSDIDYLDGYWQNADGTASLDLNGFHTGGIEQTFETKANATYVVQFSLSGNPGTVEQHSNGFWSPSNKTLDVHATGGLTTQYSFDTAPAAMNNDMVNMKWDHTPAYTFKATSSTTTLSFVSTTEGSFGPALDNIVITETVATGANCKKGGWQAMFDSAGTSFRNQGDCVSYYATGEKNLAN